MRFLLLASLAFVLACGDDDAPEDAGATDLGVDAFELRPDLGPPCELDCDGLERCCFVDGEPTCVDTRTDPENCGLCGTVCAEGRGTTCEAGFCVCGSARLGCLGTEESLCCPPVDDRTSYYCADLRADARDCGGCGIECDPRVGDRCAAGRCVCGVDSRTGCEGTDESTCCQDAFGMVACENLTIDRFNCGSCENSCEIAESCANGNCTIGPDICEERCGDAQVCCGGECCTRGACIDGVCGGADGGVPDGGPSDGGVGDADGGDGDGGS
jgi:hypothetical protein